MEPDDEDSDEIFKTLDLKNEMAKKYQQGKGSVLKLTNPCNSALMKQ